MDMNPPSRSRKLLALCALGVLVLAGCGDDESEAAGSGGSANDLSSTGGCGGPTFYAANGDDTAILVIKAHELFPTDELSSRTVELPNDDVDIRYQVGTHITGHTCDDAPEQSAQVERTYRPTAGSLEFDFEVTDPFENSRGSVTASGLELTSTTGDTIDLDEVTIIDVPVGTMTG
jgi:hypothetical protein